MDSKLNCVVLNTFDLKPQQIENIIHWCNRHFGADAWNFLTGFPGYNYRFYLPDAESETLFRLKWGT
jgi:hypothetical protein